MFTHSIAPAIILGAALIAPVLSAIADSPNFGQVATPEQIASWDTSIGPKWGRSASGTWYRNERRGGLQRVCSGCHGEKGAVNPMTA